jgi:zinc D-Ala-D-Ala dipeptidase
MHAVSSQPSGFVGLQRDTEVITSHGTGSRPGWADALVRPLLAEMSSPPASQASSSHTGVKPWRPGFAPGLPGCVALLLLTACPRDPSTSRAGMRDPSADRANTGPSAAPAPTSDAAAPASGADEPSDGPAVAIERADDFVDVAEYIPSAVLDLRYASSNNVARRQLYPVARCLLRRAVARRLAAVAVRLREQQRRLLLWDCYRPASIQRVLWELFPDPSFVAKPIFATDGTPIGGSRHSRGAAVDVSLATRDGIAIVMPTDHDDFSANAQPNRARDSSRGGGEVRILVDAMTRQGFIPITSEWWHFDAPDSASYGFSDAPLTESPSRAH